MKINKKYIVGTHVMFYEIDMIKEFMLSLKNSIEEVLNQENITVDFVFNLCEYFGNIDKSKTTAEELKAKFNDHLKVFDNLKCNLQVKFYEEDSPYTMIEYRRDLNYFGCQKNDFIIWGESDSLLPKQTFHALETLANYTDQNNIYRYVTTFAIRKMWDSSWTQLEHVDFEDKTYYEKDNSLCWTEQHSIRYTMSIEEMNTINDRYSDYDIRMLNKPQFDGSCLILTADLIKAGVNIHPGIWGIAAEDTSLMYSCMQILGQNYRQFIFKNLLKVHNREHPKKRNYILDYNSQKKSIQSNKGKWNSVMRDLNKENLSIIVGNPNKKILSYNNFETSINN